MNIKEQGLYCLLDVHLLDKCRCMRNCCYAAPLKGKVSFFMSALTLWGYLCQNEMYSNTLQKITAIFGVPAQAIQHCRYSRAAFLVNGVTEVKLQLSGTLAMPTFSSVVSNTI